MQRGWILMWTEGGVTGYDTVWFLNETELFQTWTWKSWMILSLENRFGHCKLTASCRTLSKEISFPKYHQVRSELPNSYVLGCHSGPGQVGSAPVLVMKCPVLVLSILCGLWCNQTRWTYLQTTLDHAKLERSLLVNLWEFQIWRISAGPFCQQKNSWASSCGCDVLNWPSLAIL